MPGAFGGSPQSAPGVFFALFFHIRRKFTQNRRKRFPNLPKDGKMTLSETIVLKWNPKKEHDAKKGGSA